MKVSRPLTAAAAAALDLIAPPRCLSCVLGEPGPDGLCARCVARLVLPGPAPCPVCAASLGPGAGPEACGACPEMRPRFRAARAGVRYAGLGGELVRRAKYGREALFVRPLALRLIQALEGWPPLARVDRVVCVPTTPRRRRERGFNAAEVLAEAVARVIVRPLDRRALERRGEPLPQASLPRSERRRAATGTVGVRQPPRRLRLWWPGPRLHGQRVLLVDDVLTTGATANACTGALLAAGARSVIVAVAARA